MEHLKTNLDWALYYRSIGWSPFPIPKGSKIPVIKWGKYQTEIATEDEIRAWWEKSPEANIGIATGKVSSLIVFDIDAKQGRSSKEFQFPPTICAKTGGGGEHYFLIYSGEHIQSSNGQIFGLGVDIKADGGYVVVAPSVHESGKCYEWIIGPDIGVLADIPEWLKDKLDKQSDKNEPKLWQKGINGVLEGNRNETATSMAGKIRSSLPHEFIESFGWSVFVDWNKKNSPPLSEKELTTVWESVEKYDSNNTKNDQKIIIDKPHLWTIGEILDHDFGEEDWVVEKLISKQGMTALSGNPGDFKTWLTIHKALCVARGDLVFGKFKVTKGAVLIIDEEDHIRLLKKRLNLLGAKDTDEIYYLSQNSIKVDVETVRDEILRIVKEKNIKLLILDSLVRVHSQEENDAIGMAKVFSSLQKIIKEGASILFTHHHRKQFGISTSNLGQSMRGSSDILAVVDSHIAIEHKRDEGLLVIRQTKLRQDELLNPFEVKILKGDSGPTGFEYMGDHDDKKEKIEEIASAVVVLLFDGMKSRPEIHDTLRPEYGKSAIDAGIKLAEEKGDIERVPKEELPKGEKKTFYRIPKEFSFDEPKSDLPVSQLYIGDGKQEGGDSL